MVFGYRVREELEVVKLFNKTRSYHLPITQTPITANGIEAKLKRFGMYSRSSKIWHYDHIAISLTIQQNSRSRLHIVFKFENSQINSLQNISQAKM